MQQLHIHKHSQNHSAIHYNQYISIYITTYPWFASYSKFVVVYTRLKRKAIWNGLYAPTITAQATKAMLKARYTATTNRPYKPSVWLINGLVGQCINMPICRYIDSWIDRLIGSNLEHPFISHHIKLYNRSQWLIYVFIDT